MVCHFLDAFRYKTNAFGFTSHATYTCRFRPEPEEELLGAVHALIHKAYGAVGVADDRVRIHPYVLFGFALSLV